MRNSILLTILIALFYLRPSFASNDFMDVEFDGLEFQSILTSTRLKTPHRDAPASISIITAEDIERYQFRNIPEALKTVPGFFVGESHSSYDHYFVGYHGGNANVPRRTNLIIDGISFYQAGLSRVHWEKLPVIMSEIMSIEVIRGPAASLYGSNSFTSVVNVVTKKAKDTLGLLSSTGVSINMRYGQPGVKDASLSYTSNMGELFYRLSFNHVQDDGFDVTSDGIERRDSINVNHLTFKGSYSINDTSELDFELGHTDHEQQEQFIVSFQNNFPDYEQRVSRGSLKYTNDINSNHNLQVFTYFKLFDQIQSWNGNVPAYLSSPELGNLSLINSDYANAIASGNNPIGSGGGELADMQAIAALTQISSIGALAFVPINLDVPQDFSADQFEIEIQDTLAVTDRFRLLTGASIRQVNTSSFQWVINGERNLTTYNAFANVEWKVNDNLLINGGSMYEYDKESGSTFSPRLAFSYHINDEHSLRYVYSQATRKPDIFEQFADWRLIGKNYSFNPWGDNSDFLTFYARGVSPGGLESEKITSNEIGYYYVNSSIKTDVDVRYFREDLTKLISEKLELRNFNPSNNGYAMKQGIDFQAKTSITEDLMFSLSYSYIDIDSVVLEKTISPRHIGSASFAYDVSSQFSVALSYYGFSKVLAPSPSSNPDVITTTKPLNTLDCTLRWKSLSKRFSNLNLFLQSRLRNDNAEVQKDNIYSDRLSTTIGLSVDI